ncbi:MAG: adenylate kinase [Candidatus Omnitrophica bacterium]|nr:adenylate kinase [Candidatus Omnitrophota bacterium]
MRIILLGPPGAGKGSIAALIKENLKIDHISTGDLLREEMKKDSDLGKEAKGYIAKGDLVPDDLVTKLIEKKLAHDHSVKLGYMLDGYPRTQQQAEDLDGIVTRLNEPLQYVFYLDASLNIVLSRLTGRRVCKNCGALFHMTNKKPLEEGVCDDCGGELYQRSDDNEETIKTRMNVYRTSTKPIVEYYENKGLLHRLDGDKSTQEIKDDVMKIFHEDGLLDKD